MLQPSDSQNRSLLEPELCAAACSRRSSGASHYWTLPGRQGEIRRLRIALHDGKVEGTINLTDSRVTIAATAASPPASAP